MREKCQSLRAGKHCLSTYPFDVSFRESIVSTKAPWPMVRRPDPPPAASLHSVCIFRVWSKIAPHSESPNANRCNRFVFLVWCPRSSSHPRAPEKQVLRLRLPQRARQTPLRMTASFLFGRHRFCWDGAGFVGNFKDGTLVMLRHRNESSNVRGAGLGCRGWRDKSERIRSNSFWLGIRCWSRFP